MDEESHYAEVEALKQEITDLREANGQLIELLKEINNLSHI